MQYNALIMYRKISVTGFGRGTPLYGLYMYVPRDRVGMAFEVLDP